MYDDDEEEEFYGLYEDGRWIWDDSKQQLAFESDLSILDENFISLTPAIVGSIEFRNDLDVMEQQRFRKRFQRRTTGDEDVIFLQDVKDLVLYTAPSSILTPSIIRVLHLSTTNRFIRALILYFQYYLQVSDVMGRRMLELETKVRTPRSLQVELELRENLEDLRLLVAKEYCTMVLGGADFRRFHHMGPNKKMRSLSKMDAIICESVLRISVQIVWLALSRQSYLQIAQETHRMFKSQLYNIIDHKMNTNYVAKMAPYERFVLLGHCVNEKQKLNMLSPLINEILCHRAMDFRIFGLGTIKIPVLTPRLRYMEQALSMSERLFEQNGITLGILGMPRARFDTMLREIKIPTTSSASSASLRARSVSRTSRASMRKSTIVVQNRKPYREIDIPSEDHDKEWLPEDFPTQTAKAMPCNLKQRQRWMARAARHATKQCVMKRSRNVRSFY